MSEKSTFDQEKDSLSFNTVADLYDQYRPKYPLDRLYHELAPGLDSPQNANETAIQERLDYFTQSGYFSPATVQRFL
jgi:hypothetical protein